MTGPRDTRRAEVARWLRQMRVMTLKELRQLARDTVLLVFIVYIFTFHIIIAAGGMETELRRAGVLVHDSDRSVAARELVYRFRPPYSEFHAEVADPDAGLRLLDGAGPRCCSTNSAGAAAMSSIHRWRFSGVTSGSKLNLPMGY